MSLIWNPRAAPSSEHFIELDDGSLKGLTTAGEFTIRLLKLNRAQLIAFRMKRKQHYENQQLLKQALELSAIIKQTNEQVNNLSQQQQSLLDMQLKILKILTGSDS